MLTPSRFRRASASCFFKSPKIFSFNCARIVSASLLLLEVIGCLFSETNATRWTPLPAARTEFLTLEAKTFEISSLGNSLLSPSPLLVNGLVDNRSTLSLLAKILGEIPLLSSLTRFFALFSASSARWSRFQAILTSLLILSKG